MRSGDGSVQKVARAALDASGRDTPVCETIRPLTPEDGLSSAFSSTDFSATVFSGEAADWVRYLGTPAADRYEPDVGALIHIDAELRAVAFEPENDDSEWLSEMLEDGLGRIQRRLRAKPHVLAALEAMLFENRSATEPIRLHLSPRVPSTGTRESAGNATAQLSRVRFVLRSQLVHCIRLALNQGNALTGDERLGLAWPLFSRLLSQLAYPSRQRDRFVTKIDVFARLTYVAINLLYDSAGSGQPRASTIGASHEAFVAESSGIPRALLFERHPYFRLLGRLGFLLRANPYSNYADDVRIAVREYLDPVYLRLSLAGVMPGIRASMQPMRMEKRGHKLRTPGPCIGKYGIVDAEDHEAWKAVEHPFRELGFTLLRQVGLGEFGRVYEAWNHDSREYPARVALKVDRIMGRKKHAILEAETARVVGSELAKAPHLIRLYDTGKLPGKRFTYHVLQLIDGETLDSLIGVTGAEHKSTSVLPGLFGYFGAMRSSGQPTISPGGAPSARRGGLPFRHSLSAAMVLDLVTSVLLSLEEVHQLGYAINDLKNDNLMMSRRGQVKGIDLDSYTHVRSPADKATDFMFLAASLTLLLLNAPALERHVKVPWEELTQTESRLRAQLTEDWPFGDVEAQSDGRVGREELRELLIDLVFRSRQLVYAREPELFSADIVRLITAKRRLLVEELVVD